MWQDICPYAGAKDEMGRSLAQAEQLEDLVVDLLLVFHVHKCKIILFFTSVLLGKKLTFKRALLHIPTPLLL